MTEDEKIELVIEEYREYLDNFNYDICHSIKGVWFIYRYDSIHNVYEMFYRFSTSDELKQIVIGEIINSVNTAVECTADEIVLANGKKNKAVYVDVMPDKYDFQNIVDRFMLNVRAISHTMSLIENVCKMAQSFDMKRFGSDNPGDA